MATKWSPYTLGIQETKFTIRKYNAQMCSNDHLEYIFDKNSRNYSISYIPNFEIKMIKSYDALKKKINMNCW